MISTLFKPNRRWFVPEVVQTSAMDCGPAALKCLLEGFFIPVSYGRLREACQTDVDGTSIDTLEEVAVQLGLQAEQVMVPPDHLFLPEANTLPAIAVVRLPSGITHFLVIWRTLGPFVQVMDSGSGRRWLTRQQLLDELYLHQLAVPAAGWREWAGSAEFLHPLRRRLTQLGLSSQVVETQLATAIADPSWYALAKLDAATRMVAAVVRTGGLRRGEEASRVLVQLCHPAACEPTSPLETIPQLYWSVRPVIHVSMAQEADPMEVPHEDAHEDDVEPELHLRGAVLVCVRGRTNLDPTPPVPGQIEDVAAPASLSPDLAAALAEAPSRPSWALLKLLRADGLFAPTVLLFTLFLAAGAVVLEALLLRSLFDLGRLLSTHVQRMGAISLILAFAVLLLALEWLLTGSLLRMGRKLENRLRIAFLTKLPELGDRYFQSRLVSDMAERSHSIHKLRLLPDLGRQLLRSTFEIILTTAGIIWLAPESAWLVVLSASSAIGVPLLAHAYLTTQDLRVRTHLGALGRFYHDAMLGLAPIRTHGAEPAIRREHESLLVEWARASQGFVNAMVTVEGAQMLLGFGLATWLLFRHLGLASDAAGLLLLVYWALSLPLLGQELVLAARQYPTLRNTTLRMLEPLGAPSANPSLDQPGDEALHSAVEDGSYPSSTSRGVAVTLQNVTVRAAGHTILHDITLNLAPGSHVALVGASGAGKSSLVGLLLGWHRAVAGQVSIDGQPFTAARLEELRNQTAWVDPAVQLWNRTLLANLRYGGSDPLSTALDRIINQADLLTVLEKMTDGLQTELGEGGALVSGGEGQRVRLGRAMLRSDVRLVILDEPFRGLDRVQRGLLLQRARVWWRNATLICITHDISETEQFERVVVMAQGRIIEDGTPQALAAQPTSHYRAMLDDEEGVRTQLWSAAAWRHMSIADGKVTRDDC